MSGQHPRQIDQPYTATLNFLRKIDLLRLCLEFKLPSAGTVITLRKDIKKHLNSHRDTLYHNPRYAPLYPKHRQRNRDPSPAPSFLNSNFTPSHPPSPPLSYRSPSPTPSDESWNGIQDLRLHHSPPPIHPQSPGPPPHQEATPQPLEDHDPPFPPPSDYGWPPDPPHAAFIPDGRKSHSLFPCLCTSLAYLLFHYYPPPSFPAHMCLYGLFLPTIIPRLKVSILDGTLLPVILLWRCVTTPHIFTIISSLLVPSRVKG